MANPARKSAATPLASRKTPPPVKATTRSRSIPAKEAATPSAAAKSKAEKVKKPKLVRDSFTMPKDEYTALAELKLRAAKLARPAKKSELLRAGIKALTAMSEAAFLSALKAVPEIKTGRPKKA